MRSNLCKWGVEHNSTIFICYATRANEVKLVQMRGGTQYNIHLFCSLCRWPRTCADEGWTTVQLCNLCKRGQSCTNEGTIFICFAACVDDLELVKMRGEPQYHYATYKNEVWNTVPTDHGTEPHHLCPIQLFQHNCFNSIIWGWRFQWTGSRAYLQSFIVLSRRFLKLRH